MVVYNVTVKVDWQVHDDWLAWMQEKHIPEVLNTGQFTDYRIFKLMSLDETDGATYAIQYFCDSMEQYLTYQRQYASELQNKHRERYKDKFVAFRTLMKSI